MNNFKISYEPIGGLHVLNNHGAITAFNKVEIIKDAGYLNLNYDDRYLHSVFEPAYSEFVEQLKNFDVEVIIL
jgi:hypothetical protein